MMPKQGEASLHPGVYRHFKGGRYRLVGMATHSETLEPMVIYQALYGDEGYWVRPAAMWRETVVHGGREMPRFMWENEA